MPIIYARSPYGLNPDVHGYFAMLREYQYLMKDGYIFAFPGHARPWRLYRALRHPRADERSVRTDCVPIQLLLQVLDAEDFYGTIETYQVYEKGAERFPLGNSGVNANSHTPSLRIQSDRPSGGASAGRGSTSPIASTGRPLTTLSGADATLTFNGQDC